MNIGAAIHLWEHNETRIADNQITDAHNGIAMFYQYTANMSSLELMDNRIVINEPSDLNHRAIHLTGLRPDPATGTIEGNVCGSIGIGINDCRNIN